MKPGVRSDGGTSNASVTPALAATISCWAAGESTPAAIERRVTVCNCPSDSIAADNAAEARSPFDVSADTST